MNFESNSCLVLEVLVASAVWWCRLDSHSSTLSVSRMGFGVDFDLEGNDSPHRSWSVLVKSVMSECGQCGSGVSYDEKK